MRDILSPKGPQAPLLPGDGERNEDHRESETPRRPSPSTHSTRSLTDTLVGSIVLRKQGRGGGSEGCHGSRLGTTLDSHTALLYFHCLQQLSGETKAGVYQERPLKGLKVGCSNPQPSHNCVT